MFENKREAVCLYINDHRKVSLLKKAKKSYFGNLNPSAIRDNKMFWKIISDQDVFTNSITLIQNNNLIDNDKVISEVFNDLFRNAVKNLNIEPYKLLSFDEYFLIEDDDPVFRAIRKYENYRSILRSNEAASNEREHFAFEPANF